jgi:hypothetical protein
MNIKFTPVRVVCHNTLTMAVREGEKPIRVPHTRDIRERLWFARASLEIIEATYRQIEQDFAAMAEVTLG